MKNSKENPKTAIPLPSPASFRETARTPVYAKKRLVKGMGMAGIGRSAAKVRGG